MRLRKDLCAAAFIHSIFEKFSKISEPASRQRSEISLTDCLMSCFAMFSLKWPSLLQYDIRKPKVTVTYALSLSSSTGKTLTSVTSMGTSLPPKKPADRPYLRSMSALDKPGPPPPHANGEKPFWLLFPQQKFQRPTNRSPT